MQPIILAIDTATDACSVALCTANGNYNAFVVEPQAHSKLLLGMVNDVCQEAGIALKDVDALAYGRGPGSFTGVRIAASVIQGLCVGLQKPVIGISSLHALAQQAANLHNATNILALIDARMHEVYWGIYTVPDNGNSISTMADSLQKPEDLRLEPTVAYLAVGTGADVYANILHENNKKIQFDNTVQFPRAQEVLQLAIEKYNRRETMPANAAVPTYVRNDVAKKSKKNPDLGSRD